MIYQTGTITATAGQTKIKGTGTRWKDNLSGISEGCPISYFINNVVYMNTVLSVNSDTEINLTYPVPVAASAAKYQIATFVLDSMSDGVRKMLANQQYIQYFLRNMDTWMTQDGIVEIKTPTGETVRLESIIALKKLIDGKFDKKGGTITGRVDADSVITASQLTARTPENSTVQMNPINSGPRIEHRINGGTWYTHTLPNATGTLMQVGDSGIGLKVSPPLLASVEDFTNAGIGFYLASDSATSGLKPLLATGSFHGSATVTRYNAGNSNCHALLIKNYGSDWLQIVRRGGAGSELESCLVWHSKNTTKDANGNLKAASPIIKVFADHIDLNDESEGVKLEKLGTGRYKLKGTLGMNSDASWGGIHGGLVVPNGINNLPLIWADFDVLPDGDIIIETRYRKHTLHPRLEAQRLMTYPEFLDENNIEREDYDYCDIPNGHWIDVRVNMPSDSIYNQKLAEAERLAKIEAELVAKEEAKRTAEEAEMAEQEAEEHKQDGLGDNCALL
ncbi:phage tail fiber protein [Providencia sp. wls1938]|uniref:phage tail fiber protein n=1 Tax=Providencia sp. wls1938 TaxID=2675151 RepID=UPI0018A7C83B|nr:hypothetical protein [Providencia sp. wls1938]